MAILDRFRNLSKEAGPTQARNDEQTSEWYKATDWTFIDEFAEAVANESGTCKGEVWRALYPPNSRQSLSRIDSGPNFDFKEEDMPGTHEKFRDWITEHPQSFITMIACLAAPPTAIAITPVVLGLLGFGPLGVVAGAPAALLQSSLGPIAAQSAFAILTSAGMGGMGLTVVQTIAACGAFGGVCTPAAVSFLAAMEHENSSCE